MSLRDPNAAPPDPSRRRADVVEWLRSMFPNVPLAPPSEASDDDLCAALAGGTLLCALLRRICPGALLDDASTDSVGRFYATVERIGMPAFSAQDLDRSQMPAVINCILSLKDRFGPRDGEERGLNNIRLAKLQRVLSTPLMSEPFSPSAGVDLYSPTRAFQMKRGGYADLPGCNVSDLMKSTSLDHAPTQSLLGVVNSILDESIERKNGQIPYRIACLLRKVIDEIERRMSTQAGHIRNQNNLMKAREEKYQSRIRVLEELAGGASGQTHTEKDRFYKGQLAEEDMARLTKYKEDVIRLMKEKDDMGRLLKEKEDMITLLKEIRLLKEKDDVVRLTEEKEEMIRLLKEKEDIIRLLMKEKEDKVDLKKGNVENRKQSTDEDSDRSIKEKDDIIRLMKEKEDGDNIIMKLKMELQALSSSHEETCKMLESKKEDIVKLLAEKADNANLILQLSQDKSTKENGDITKLIKEKEDSNKTAAKLKLELEALRSSYEESCKLLESKKEDIVKLLADKENIAGIILQLRQELEATKTLHEAQSQQLQIRAAEVKKDLEQRINKLELMLEDSTKRRKELEDLFQSRNQFWKQKDIVVNQFVGLQIQNVQDLRLSSVSVRHEILNCQKTWLDELADLGQNLKVVTNAAEKYHAALAENKKMFNEIQELKGNIRVYCRIRPFQRGEDAKSSSVEYIGDNGELVLSNPAKQGKEASKNFTFNKVYGPTSTQDGVFKDIQPLIRSVLDGYNVCIFAYGQTGSGKHTLWQDTAEEAPTAPLNKNIYRSYNYQMGPDNAKPEEWGVNYRALNDLFIISHERRDIISYELSVQMIEIYNEQIRDLLASGGSQKKIGIQNTTQPNGLTIPDATMCPVNSTASVIELMQTGHGNRAMSVTAMNERSSRSHSVVTIHVRGQDLKSGEILRGDLHLVDLAGSERVDRSEVTGDRLKEAQHINKSLAALGDVIFSLSQKNAHVPYRNSKLTQVLQTSVGGHAKTLMFVQVNPDALSYTETLSTLKFAERVSGVELGAAKTNKDGKEGGKDVRELMDQLSLLKDTISKKDDEIERLQLQNTSSSRLKPTNKQTNSLLKHSYSSPGMTSPRKTTNLTSPATTTSPRKATSVSSPNITTSPRKVTSVASMAASDPENMSDGSDRHSEDTEVSSLGELDPDRRLSDVSDGGNSAMDSSLSSVAKTVSRIQKLAAPKASNLRPRPRDSPAPKPSAATGLRRSPSTAQATPSLTRTSSSTSTAQATPHLARTTSTSKRFM